MALTKVAAVNPPVRASTATPSGMATSMAVSPEGSPWSRLWRSSHSLTKPHSGGRAQMARPATMNTGALRGSRFTRPPSRSRSRSPVACWSELAERNSEPLNTAWNTTCKRAATRATTASGRCPVAAKRPEAPTPSSIRPTLSVVEYANRRLRSVLVDECRAPKSADSPPSPMTRSHHHAGPPPSRVSPTRMIP